MSTCQKTLMAQGRPYSRTCQKCGLFGKCIEKQNITGLESKEQAEPEHIRDVTKMVRLTDEEMLPLYNMPHCDQDMFDFGNKVQDLLIKKNGGA